MKLKTALLNEAFDERELKENLGDGVTSMWEGFNKIETSINYMQKNGQGGLVGAFKKKYRIQELQDILNELDKYTSY